MSVALSMALEDADSVMPYRRCLSAALSRATQAGHLVRLLPRVYASADRADDFHVRIRALFLSDPDAVVVGRAAAALTFWPELRVDVIEAVRRGAHPPAKGFRWRRRRLEPEHVVTLDSGVRVTTAAVTVLDLLCTVGGQAIDHLLRRAAGTLNDLWQALTELPHRRGNPLRRNLLEDSRDEPWSEAERAFHRILRDAGIARFRTNAALVVGGQCFVPDVRIDRLRLIFEVDGYSYHRGPAMFSADRQRDITLALGGWHCHRFAAVTIADHPDMVRAQVRELVAQRAAERGVESPLLGRDEHRRGG